MSLHNDANGLIGAFAGNMSSLIVALRKANESEDTTDLKDFFEEMDLPDEEMQDQLQAAVWAGAQNPLASVSRIACSKSNAFFLQVLNNSSGMPRPRRRKTARRAARP